MSPKLVYNRESNISNRNLYKWFFNLINRQTAKKKKKHQNDRRPAKLFCRKVTFLNRNVSCMLPIIENDQLNENKLIFKILGIPIGKLTFWYKIR